MTFVYMLTKRRLFFKSSRKACNGRFPQTLLWNLTASLHHLVMMAKAATICPTEIPHLAENYVTILITAAYWMTCFFSVN